MPPVTKCKNAGACYCNKSGGSPCSGCKKGSVFHCGDHEHGCHSDCAPM